MTAVSALVGVVLASLVLVGCSSSPSGPAGQSHAASPTVAPSTPHGPREYLVAACRYFAVRDVVRLFPPPAGLKWQQEHDQQAAGECHWFTSGSSADTNRPRDDFAVIISATSPDFGPAPPASEPTYDDVPAQIRARVAAGVHAVHLGSASGWFEPSYLLSPGDKIASHLDLAGGQYNLVIYADTSHVGSQDPQVEDAATAASDLSAAEKIATAILPRLPAVPPPPTTP
jgi:hypothetical protein